MFLLLIGSALAGSTLHLSTELDLTLEVAGSPQELRRRKELDLDLEPGTHRISGPGYAADLDLPDKVQVWLRWDGVKLVLDEAMTDKQARAGKAMKLGNAAMAVGAGAQQAQAIGSDLSAAGSDMDKAQRGELTESSRTEVSVDVGPDGVSSSSSRTTAGADGVQGHSRSTEIGPDGVATRSGTATLTGEGTTESGSSMSASFMKLESGLEVRLTPVAVGSSGGAAPIAAAPAAAPAAPAPAAAPAPPKAPPAPKALKEDYAKWFKDTLTTADGVTVKTFDAFLEANAGKLAMLVENGGDGFLAFRGYKARGAIGGSEVEAEGGKVKPPRIIEPKGKERQTLGFVGTGLQVDGWELSLDGVVEALPRKGTLLDPGPFTLAGSTTFDLQGLRCTVVGLKKKTQVTAGKLDCTYSGDDYVLIDASKLAVTVEGKDWANGARSKGVEVLSSGESTKVAFSWEIEGRVADMQFHDMPLSWGDTFSVAKGTPVKLGRVRFELDADKTKAEN